MSIFGLAASRQCSLLQLLLQQESWVQRQSAVPELVEAGGRRGGDTGANEPAKDSVTIFAVISSPGELVVKQPEFEEGRSDSPAGSAKGSRAGCSSKQG